VAREVYGYDLDAEESGLAGFVKGGGGVVMAFYQK
jgi:hypothetical protein